MLHLLPGSVCSDAPCEWVTLALIPMQHGSAAADCWSLSPYRQGRQQGPAQMLMRVLMRCLGRAAWEGQGRELHALDAVTAEALPGLPRLPQTLAARSPAPHCQARSARVYIGNDNA